MRSNMNTSSNSTEHESWSPSLSDKLAVTVTFGVIILTGVVGNVLVIVLVAFVRKMRTAVNLCLGSLALADLIVLVFLPTLPIVDLFDLDSSFMGRNFCIFVSSVDRGAVVGSTLIFLLIGVERYTVLCYPLKTLGTWTSSRICGLLCLIWLVTVGVSVPMGYGTRYQEFEFDNRTRANCYSLWDEAWVQWYDITLLILSYFLPIPLLVVLYGKMIIALGRQVPSQNDRKCTGTRTARRARLQVIIMLVSVLVIFVVCLLPFNIYIIYGYVNPESLNALGYKLDFAISWSCRLMLYLNHIANPIVYFLMSGNFREAFRLLFCNACNRINFNGETSHTNAAETK